MPPRPSRWLAFDAEPDLHVPRWRRVTFRVSFWSLFVLGLALVIVLWTGVGGPGPGAAFRERLSWSDATLPALPDPPDPPAHVAGDFHHGYGAQDETWPLSAWPNFVAIGLILVACAATFFAERKRRVRYEPMALLAVALISAGGLWLIHGSYVHVRSGGWEGPQYLKWRTAPTFVQPALGLLGGAVCAAAWALVCIARWRSRGVLRRGAPLSLASLVIGAMWLMFIDEVYLAPRHAKPRPTWVDMKLPLAATSKSPSPFPWNADIQMQAWSNEGVTQIAFHSATHWTNRWELPRLQPDGWQGSVDDPGWRDWLDDAVGRMPQEGDSNGERFPDSAVLLRFEAGLRFGDIAPLLERAQSLGVWKYFVATSGAEMPGALFGFFVYTTRHGTDDLQGVRHRTGTITVRSVEGSLEYSCGDLRARELPAFFAALVEAEGRDFTALLDVEEDVKWSDVVRVVEACSPGLDGFAR